MASHLQAYSIKRQIGKGSYGQVFLVTTKDERKKYVMKKIKLPMSSHKERLVAEQEATLLSSLHHPNIVSYKESFQDTLGVLHIIMGYCEGGDLCSRLKTCKGSLLSEPKVVEWFVQIALGLQYLHDHNILHRDLKTQNIFLSKNDIIKVGDLGIARVLDSSCDLAHTVVGTPYYMSPELYSNQPYNHKSDIWALGCCVYEMASLKQAFSAHNINALMYKIIKGKVPPIPSLYSQELASLVQLMMARNADRRPTVYQILRKSFIRKHISMFLDRATEHKRKVKPSIDCPQSKSSLAVLGDDDMQRHQVAHMTTEPVGIDTKDHIKPCEVDAHSQLVGLQKNTRDLPAAPVMVLNTDGVSSARQRRRMNKYQEGHGKKIIKTSDECGGSEHRIGGGPCGNGRDQDHVDGVAKANQSDRVDGDGGLDYQIDSDQVDPQVDQNDRGHDLDRKEDISIDNEHNLAPDEVEELYILLDSTLHLPKTDSPPVPTSSQLPSGRLKERAGALRHECVDALGDSLVCQVMELLSRADPEEIEEDLLSLLGVKNFELFAAKLQQLKLCEESL